MAHLLFCDDCGQPMQDGANQRALFVGEVGEIQQQFHFCFVCRDHMIAKRDGIVERLKKQHNRELH